MNTYFDLEWRQDGKIFLFGYAHNSRDKGALYGHALTHENIFDVFTGSSFVFFWGPDCGRIENYFGERFSDFFRCVNLLSVVRDTVRARNYRLDTIERKFGIDREVNLKDQRQDIYQLWLQDPETVVKYNIQDALSLYYIEQILRQRYGLTAYDFRQYVIER